jgi:hypothetical protein
MQQIRHSRALPFPWLGATVGGLSSLATPGANAMRLVLAGEQGLAL